MRGACQSCGRIGIPELDSTSRAPIGAKPLTGTGKYSVGKQGWMFFYGVIGAGWEIKLGPANAVPIRRGSKFPVPPEGFLEVTAAGTGTPLLVTWPEAVALALIADNAETTDGSSGAPTDTALETVEMDGTAQTYTPPPGTLYTVVTLYDLGTTAAVGTDATMPVNVGPNAQLASWEHFGTNPIYFQGVNAQFINFTNQLA